MLLQFALLAALPLSECFHIYSKASHYHRYDTVLHRRSGLRCSLRMDDEVARPGIKEELTTREEYLDSRFTRLSPSGHDLTPWTREMIQDYLECQQCFLGLCSGTAKLLINFTFHFL